MFAALHVVALVGYGLTGAFAAAPLLGLPRPRTRQLVPLVSATGAVAVHFGALLAYAQAFGSLPLTGVAPAISSLAFLVALLSLAIQWLTRERAIAVVAAPLAATLLGASLAVGFGPLPTTSVPRGAWFVVHVAASLLGLALVAVGFAASALYVLQHRELKARRFGAIFQVLPPLEQLDGLNRLALAVGFPTLTLGIGLALGYLGLRSRPVDVGAGHLGWGLLAWATIGLLAAGRVSHRLQGRRAAVGSILGFGLIAVGYLFLMLLDAIGTT